ncbi:MAG TPA: DUF4350 domain-containing protein [Polyangiaceae bacterium]|nr:DUF4350 domain-containing protein [Polyangiaceae bacterium]
MSAAGRRARAGWALAGGLALCSRAVPAQDATELDPRGVRAALEASLESGAAPFCRDAEHVLSERERALCPFAAEAAQRCPAFAAACAGAQPEPRQESGWWFMVRTLLRALGVALFWVLLAAAACLVGWLALRLLPASPLVRRELAQPGADPVSEPELPEFERAFQAHLERARQLAAQGLFAEAAAEVQLGVVLRLDALGLILARRGRTNGDYARDLADRPELQAAFGALTRTTEAVQFGGRRLDQGMYQRLLEQAAPLLGAFLIGLGLCAASGCARSGAQGPSTLAHVCGVGAEGHSLFCALFDSGLGVRQRFRPLEGPEPIADDVGAVLVLPNHLEEGAWAGLQHWVEAGGVALLAAPAPKFEQEFSVSRASASCGPHAAVLPASERQALVSVGPSWKAEPSPVLQPLALCETGEPYILQASLGEGRILFLPGSGLLSNAGLLAGDNARLLANVFELPRGRVEIIGELTRDAVSSPLSAVNAAGLTPWLCQLLLLAAAFAAYRGTAFGRRVEAPADLRRRFSEHVQALGQRWAEQRASRSALSAYAGYGLEVVRERVPAGAGQSSTDLARAVARKTGREHAPVAQTLELARRAREGEGSAGDETEDLRALRDLGRLIEDLGGIR